MYQALLATKAAMAALGLPGRLPATRQAQPSQLLSSQVIST